MSGPNLFTPQSTGTISLTTSVASSRVALSNKSSSLEVRVTNLDATNEAYIEFGISTVVAVVPGSNGSSPGSLCIGPGKTEGYSIGPAVTHVAGISAAGTPKLMFTPGNGSLT